MRADVTRSELDSEGRKALDDFVNAKFRTPIVNQDAWESALTELAGTRDKDALLQAYLEHLP